MKSRRSGFTLIELVVVIMILGILAAVAAPKFLSTSGTATDNGLKQTLSIIRDAIEMYSAKYGVLPVCDAAPHSAFRTSLSYFMRNVNSTTFPVCPVGPNQNNTISIQPTGPTTTADTTPTTGWKFNQATGAFIVNCASASNVGGNYDTF